MIIVKRAHLTMTATQLMLGEVISNLFFNYVKLGFGSPFNLKRMQRVAVRIQIYHKSTKRDTRQIF